MPHNMSLMHVLSSFFLVVQLCVPSQSEDILEAGERLYVGDRLYSSSSLYKLVMQSDGNFVGYDESNNNAFWSSGTAEDGTGSDYRVTMQISDCNLVLRDSSGSALWTSKTGGLGYSNCYLQMRNNRNIVMYSPDGDIVWQSDTAIASMFYQ